MDGPWPTRLTSSNAKCPHAGSNCGTCLRRAIERRGRGGSVPNFRIFTVIWSDGGSGSLTTVWLKCCHSVTTGLPRLRLAFVEIWSHNGSFKERCS